MVPFGLSFRHGLEPRREGYIMNDRFHQCAIEGFAAKMVGIELPLASRMGLKRALPFGPGLNSSSR